MKILQICPDFPPHVRGGGAETFRLLAEAWTTMGNDVHVVTSFPLKSSSSEKTEQFGFSVKFFKLLPTVGIFREAAYFFPAGFLETIRLVRNIRNLATNSDIIVIHSIMETVPLISLFTLRKFSSKVVVTSYGISTASYSRVLSFLSRILYGSIGKIAISNMRNIFVYSDISRKEFVALFNKEGRFSIYCYTLGTDVSRLLRAYNEVILKENSYNKWLTNDLGIDRPFVLSIGRNVRTKGFDILIDAFSALTLNYPDLMLIIAGDITDYTEELRQLSRNLNLDGKVKFIGRIDEFKKVYLMTHCRCLIIPSRKEGYGLNAVEARIFMIPTVATRTGAHEEILDLPDINKLIDAGNKEQLHNAILAIMKTPRQKPEFDVTAAKKYDISSLAQHYIDFANSKLIFE